MTDMITGSNQGQDTSVSLPMTGSQNTMNVSDNQEKVLRQSEVNDLIGRAKHDAVERYKRESSIVSHNAPSQGERTFTADDVKRMAAEEAQRLMDQRQEDSQRIANEQNAQRIASEFFTKLSLGREKYQDFDTVMGDMDFTKLGNTVQLARSFDNVGEMMYHLRKHPTQMASIEMLSYQNPKLAFEELSKLSQSIKTNEQAGNIKLPNEPLGQLKPSNTSTDSGVMSIRDLRNKYRG